MRRRTPRFVIAGLLGALLFLSAAIPGKASVVYAQIFGFPDDFLDLSKVDTARTTAAVATAVPGTVSLPSAPAGMAWDGATLRIAHAQGISAWRRTSAGMRPALDLFIDFPAFSLSAFPAGEFVATDGREVRVYQSGRLVWSEATSDATAVAAGDDGFWIVYRDRADLFMRTGAGYEQKVSIPGLREARTAAYRSGLLAVAEADRVRLFRRTLLGFREDPSATRMVTGATGLAWWDTGTVYRVLTSTGVQNFAADSPRSWDELGVPGGVALAPLGNDVTVLAQDGAKTFSQGRIVDALTVTPVPGLGYQLSAVLQSKVFPVDHQVSAVRLQAGLAALPPGTSIAYEVSTDGGATWMPAPLDTIVPVPPGDQFTYRATLQTTDASVSPILDWIDVSEVQTYVQAATAPHVVLIR